ncbi:hypothetical protein IEKLDGGM_24815, partial [Escherichia coli]|uniref:hypothetical protein n=1 Tax=Escherichia coli TaxID=562 RepID=UPI002DF53EDF|nr:hypothetical protein [Escherichia coli]MEC4798298.1 hypothetical protein [Escherichia coli]
DRNRSHWSTSKTPSYTKSVSWQHHPQLGTKSGRKGDYTQAREWGYDENGNLVPKRDIDFTDHGRPKEHPNPHQHDYIPNPTGGTLQHGPAKDLEIP